MRLKDYTDPKSREAFREKGYRLPSYEREVLKRRTSEAPVWLHFGAGNIFRAYQADLMEQLLERGEADRGIIVAEAYDEEILDRAYRPFDDLSLSVVLHSDGRTDKKIIGCITESLKADRAFPEDWERLREIFRKESLQMVTFSITENGYGAPEEDVRRGLTAETTMGKVTALLYERFLAGGMPLTLQSMDNMSLNGDKVRAAVSAYAEGWCLSGLVPEAFSAYVGDESRIACPLCMIDKITPRPDPRVQKMLAEEGFRDNEWIETVRHSFTAPYVNAEETGYLVVEDRYPNGRPPLEKAGVIFTDRETVEKTERMKVGTCLNPLHTALAVFGCMMGFRLVSDIMADPDLLSYLEHLGNDEGLPVCESPGILDPKQFMDECLYQRFPNVYVPDTPQRIAVDTSTIIAIRFGGTLKRYLERGKDLNELTFIPLLFAGYARYLRGLSDDLEPFRCSPDDRLNVLQPIVAGLEVREGEQEFSCLHELFQHSEIFGIDLYAAGLGGKVEAMTKELFQGKGAIRRTLRKYLGKETDG